MCLAAIDAGGLAEAGKAAGCVEGRRWCLSLAVLALGAGPAPNPRGAGHGDGVRAGQGWSSLGHVSQDQALKIWSWIVHSSVCDSPLGELPPIDWIAYCLRVKLLMQIGLCLLFLQAAFSMVKPRLGARFGVRSLLFLWLNTH